MKLTGHAWILWGIALAVDLILSFAIPFSRVAVFWIALFCTMVMFALCAFAFFRAFRKDSTMQSKLLGWPIFKVGIVMLSVQFIIGFVLMGAASLCPAWLAVLTEVILFAITAFSMTVKDAAREIVTVAETIVTDRTHEWKAIRAHAAAIASGSDNPALKKLAEMIRFADPTPTSMDGEIALILESLSSDANAANIDRAFALLEKRKVMAKEEKKTSV